MDIVKEAKTILPTLSIKNNDFNDKRCGCVDHCCCFWLCSDEDINECKKKYGY